jgi:hypothetical protein
MIALKDGATVPQNGQVSREIWSILKKDPDKLQNKFDFDLPETESKSPAPDKTAAEREDEREKEPRHRHIGPHERRVMLNESGVWVRHTDLDKAQVETVGTGAIYDHEKGAYWIPCAEDNWIKANKETVESYMRIDHQMDSQSSKAALNATVRLANVEFVTQMAGYSKGVYSFPGGRILVPKSPEIIEGVKGDWSFIRGYMEQFFETPEQLEHELGSLSWARKALINGTMASRQATAYAGEHGCGKNAYLSLVKTPILGGRSANPFQYMVGQTAFNLDIIKAEHLIISDQLPLTDYESKVTFGSKIKDLCVNREQRLHAKGKDAIIVEPFWRISIALNDDDDSLSILPPLDDAILEKMMLFRVGKPNCLPKGSSIDAQRVFASAIRKGLPAFIYYLENEHEIKAEIQDGRFGIAAYHHPRFLTDIIDLSPAGQLWELMERAGIIQTYDGDSLGGEFDEDGRLIPGSGRTLELESKDIYEKLVENPKTRDDVKKYGLNAIKIGKHLQTLKKRPDKKMSISVRPGRSNRKFWSFRLNHREQD